VIYQAPKLKGDIDAAIKKTGDIRCPEKKWGRYFCPFFSGVYFIYGKNIGKSVYIDISKQPL
jgi:hypothetical protein